MPEAKPREKAAVDEEASWARWMEAAQDGNREAYERLLRSILPAIRRYVQRRWSDSAGVEDVVQNTLVSIHQARHTFRPERPFGPWMRAIARNALIDAQRAAGRRQRREVSLDAPERAEAGVSAFEIDEGLSPRLRRALAELPPSQREAVELIHLQELRVTEAAERVGVSPGALKVRAHRGYKALRRLLGDPDGAE